MDVLAPEGPNVYSSRPSAEWRSSGDAMYWKMSRLKPNMSPRWDEVPWAHGFYKRSVLRD